MGLHNLDVDLWVAGWWCREGGGGDWVGEVKGNDIFRWIV